MATQADVTWLAYRRRRWLAGFAAALLLALAWAGLGGSDPEIVVYNDSPQPLGSVRVAIGATAIEFPPLAPGESAARPLPLRVGGEIGLWLPVSSAPRIAGPWVEPGETAQVVARVGEFGEVLFSPLPTWRARFLAALR